MSGEIEFDSVTKRYPVPRRAKRQGTGTAAGPAVDAFSATIAPGTTTVLLGSSGSGKTTLMRMVNRMVEPSSGRVLIDGEDVAGRDPVALRRSIGYVMQNGGLLPHRRVIDNITLVPRLNGTGRAQAAHRAHELMDILGLDPALAERYPHELSGGQAQRVGVARALAADPAILLMDEPFGAVDPITRQRLQDELIHIQSELHKTVVFVTHDFDEAIKLGDWIVIFNVGGQIMQYDTPDQILANPANEFVEDFIGSGAGLRQLGLARVSAVQLKKAVRARPGEDTREVAKRIRDAGVRHAVVLDLKERPVGWVTPKQLLRTDRVKTKYSDDFPLVGVSSSLDDALDAMLVAGSTEALVHGKRGRFLGLITVNTVIRAMEEISSKNPEDTPDAPMGHNAGASTEDADSEAVDSEDGSQASESSAAEAEAPKAKGGAQADAPEADAAPENSGEGV